VCGGGGGGGGGGVGVVGVWGVVVGGGVGVGGVGVRVVGVCGLGWRSRARLASPVAKSVTPRLGTRRWRRAEQKAARTSVGEGGGGGGG